MKQSTMANLTHTDNNLLSFNKKLNQEEIKCRFPYEMDLGTVLLLDKDRNMLADLRHINRDDLKFRHVPDPENVLETMANGTVPSVVIANMPSATPDWSHLIKHQLKQGYFNEIPLILLLDSDCETKTYEYLQAGAIDAVVKPVSLQILLAKIVSLINMQLALEKKFVEFLHASVGEKMQSGKLLHDKIISSRQYDCLKNSYDLTYNEMEIVKLIDKGLAHKEIAQILRLSESTVKNAAHLIYQKCFVNSKTELVAMLHSCL